RAVWFLFQAEERIRVATVTGVQTCALPILRARWAPAAIAAPSWRPASASLDSFASTTRSTAATSRRGSSLLACLNSLKIHAPWEIGRASWRERGWIMEAGVGTRQNG